MTEPTKYDLCSSSVTLDYQELLQTARIAVRYSLQALENRLRDWYDYAKTKPVSSSGAEWMLEDAKALAVATTALHYLNDGLSREEVIVANKPEVEEI